ncbi:putative lppJ [Mycobacterium kansasii 732]|uniref:hypothetical protein n=1 Tax=Mycobacterium pseudokansasii TaxID=2341080 RepID=UPI000445BB70|nr:hypothetical protein [Mycobacterium pseudokansasii]EUA07952.1 putative lppJ [Mycobacterium kansasii 732]MBY0390127.1 hypothetical protein [Mycobacterium pseudokansasii]VAZ87153.1 Putative lipoprotein LppJ [Mycobacterium pseudokansasii]VAZ87631.1 Putative lipoprotein LppJ [Mycobacterium pseudokansasii]
MWTRRVRIAVAAVSISTLVGGCAEVVRHPISPQQAREQVLVAARDLVNSLHADVTEATFSYESCNDQGEPPFRGVVDLSFWMPGVSRNGPADPKTVISALVADGWSTDSDFKSHSPTLRKKGVNAIVTVVPPALHGEGFNSHVGVKLDGECRDTFDHRTDRSILPVDISREIQQS